MQDDFAGVVSAAYEPPRDMPPAVAPIGAAILPSRQIRRDVESAKRQ